MRRVLAVLAVTGALLIAAPAGAHQETTAASRMVIGENGKIDYALKIPVEDLAEPLGRPGHAPLNAREVRAAEELLFIHFSPLVSVSSGGMPCRMERNGIDVPEDERLYGELRFVFHCPADAPVVLDYRVFFDVDPRHMGMLEVDAPAGKARAELIVERPRWEISPSAEGPPRLRALEGPAALRASNERARAKPGRHLPSYWTLGVLVLVVAGAGAFYALRVTRRASLAKTPPKAA